MSEQSLGEALPKEMARVREVMRAYQDIGPAGSFAVAMMEQTLRQADKAIIEGDIAEMVRSYKELTEFDY